MENLQIDYLGKPSLSLFYKQVDFTQQGQGKQLNLSFQQMSL